jgi:hypothetical protein
VARALTAPSSDRRRFARLSPPFNSHWGRAWVRPGRDVRILNLSRGGAEVEATSRLLPGTIVEVQVTGPRACWLRPALIVRCEVSALVSDECVRYRAGLEFRAPLDAEAESNLLAAFRDPIGEPIDGYQVPAAGSWDT